MPTYTRESHNTQHDREAPTTHPINETRLSMQGNPAYGTDDAIASKIEIKQNVAYEHNNINIGQRTGEEETTGHPSPVTENMRVETLV